MGFVNSCLGFLVCECSGLITLGVDSAEKAVNAILSLNFWKMLWIRDSFFQLCDIYWGSELMIVTTLGDSRPVKAMYVQGRLVQFAMPLVRVSRRLMDLVVSSSGLGFMISFVSGLNKAESSDDRYSTSTRANLRANPGLSQ